mgnify:FL=1
MKYCQGPKCHEHKTKDRIRGPKGDKHYETRKRSSFYYHDEFCSLMCQDEWFKLHGKRAIDHYGRTHEPKRTNFDDAWYKFRDWQSRDGYYFVNDLLGQRIPITQQQYQDQNLTQPS